MMRAARGSSHLDRHQLVKVLSELRLGTGGDKTNR